MPTTIKSFCEQAAPPYAPVNKLPLHMPYEKTGALPIACTSCPLPMVMHSCRSLATGHSLAGTGSAHTYLCHLNNAPKHGSSAISPSRAPPRASPVPPAPPAPPLSLTVTSPSPLPPVLPMSPLRHPYHLGPHLCHLCPLRHSLTCVLCQLCLLSITCLSPMPPVQPQTSPPPPSGPAPR